MSENEFGYPPFDTPKPVAEGIWIVDGAPKRVAGVSVPVRMTVVRLTDGGLWLHSPTRFDAGLLRALESLGPVRHLVAPSFGHWTYLARWQQHCPEATAWAPPELRKRPQVKASKVRFDRDLEEDAPGAWAADLRQAVIPGAFGFCEVAFFHIASRTLVLTDLILAIETDRAPLPTRIYARLSGTRAPDGGTPRYLRLIVRRRRKEAATAARRMIGWAPERVIFAHGRWYASAATERLRKALAWLLR